MTSPLFGIDMPPAKESARSPENIASVQQPSMQLSTDIPGSICLDAVVSGDCLIHLAKLRDGAADLCVADPPFNINYNGYDVYDDSLNDTEYLKWSRSWLDEVTRVLSPNGSFWLAIGDSYAAELDVMCRREFGLHRRSWCIHHFSFGVNCERKFTPSHVHLFHYVVNPKDFTFNGEAIKVPSARQLVYKDRRARAGGRLPNDVWVLLPQHAQDAFRPDGDVWFEPRVCGTFKERVAHPCQMPLAVLDRVVKVSSNPGDLVLDPFAGSGTTLVAAKRLGRRYLGFELSEAYAGVARARLEQTPSPEAALAV